MPTAFNTRDLYVDLTRRIGIPLHLKCEGFNFAGSIKLKPAIAMVQAAERAGRLKPGGLLIESSSGNLGLALSIIAADRGYQFLCVTDDRCNPATVAAMRAYGTTVEIITDPDPEGGYLAARLRRVDELLAENPGSLWLDQYRNYENWLSHYRSTASEIAEAYPNLRYLFVGAGTTGTVSGCARYMLDHYPSVQVIGVDSRGSVNFGTPSAPRQIPGLGSGIPPHHLDLSDLADTVLVDEIDTIRMCRRLARTGLLFGGSTGTVVAGAERWLAGRSDVVAGEAVTLAPDLGERYLGSIYDDAWVTARFPELAFELQDLQAAQ